MAARILTGPLFNFLARAKAVTMYPDVANANFPATNLYDDSPSRMAQFNAASSDETVLVDLQHLLNGDMEGGFTGGIPNSWTKIGGGVTSDSTAAATVHGGTHAVAIDSSSGTTAVSQYITGKPGEAWVVTAWARSAASGAVASLYIRNNLTGKWWAGTSWAGTSSAAAQNSSSSYVQLSASFTLEATPLLYNLGTTPLRVLLEGRNGGASSSDHVVYFDDVEAYPKVDYVGIFGHNIDPCISPTLQSSSDTLAWTTQASVGVLPLTFYSVLSAAVGARYWQVVFGGTQLHGGSTAPGTPVPIWLGEMVLGQSVTLLRPQDYAPKIKHHEAQVRTVAPAGQQFVFVLGGGAVRTLTLGYTETATTEYQQLRDQVYRQARGGRDSIVVVPWDANPDVCVYGRLNADLDETWELVSTYWRLGISIIEAPFPVVL